MHDAVVFTAVPFLPDRHKGPLIAHPTREGVGHMCVCAIDLSYVTQNHDP